MMVMCVMEHREDPLGVWNKQGPEKGQQKNVAAITVDLLSLLYRERWDLQDPLACQALW